MMEGHGITYNPLREAERRKAWKQAVMFTAILGVVALAAIRVWLFYRFGN